MHLLAGTRQGVYRGAPGAFDEAVRVLDSDRVMRVRRFDGRTYAATRSGLYRSTDGGESWNGLEVPHSEVYSVCEHPPGERLFAGTHPAHLYRSTDGGDTWAECEGLQDVPSRAEWHTPRHRNEAHVRSLGAAGPDRLVAGVEVGGVLLSEDGGDTWTERRGGVSASDASGGSPRSERREGVHDDVHHVLVRGDDHWVASTGGGLYRTRDAGASWNRLDGPLAHRYFREAFAHDGRLYAAATRGPPPTWDGPRETDAALFESDDGGDSFEAVDYPDAPGPFVLSWAAHGEDVYAGTSAGQVLHRTDDGWIAAGSVPASVASLAVVE